MRLDLRNKFVHNMQVPEVGSVVKWYDIFNEHADAEVGAITWRTPWGTVEGQVIETGYEARPQPTFWMAVKVTAVRGDRPRA